MSKRETSFVQLFLALADRYADEARGRGATARNHALQSQINELLMEQLEERDSQLASLRRVKEAFEAENEQLLRENATTPTDPTIRTWREEPRTVDVESIRPSRSKAPAVRTAGCVSATEITAVLDALEQLVRVANRSTKVSPELTDALEDAFMVISDSVVPRDRLQMTLFDAMNLDDPRKPTQEGRPASDPQRNDTDTYVYSIDGETVLGTLETRPLDGEARERFADFFVVHKHM